jgi:phosphoenolpyruvate-protein kinase (PTS system EI component)
MRIRLSLSGESVIGLGSQPFEGVGLLRSEFILRERLHSLRDRETRSALARYLHDAATEFRGRPCWYRFTDLWSDEAAVLAGAPSELPEQNPIIGLRGVRRGLVDPELLAIEMALVGEVSRSCPNIGLMFPYVEDANQFARLRDLARKAGFQGALGSMLEIPAAVLDAPAFVRAGAFNLLVGLNDLSSLFLGTNRSDEAKAHPLLWQLISQMGESLPSGADWGIAGLLTPELMACARHARVPYVSVHYAQVPDLLSLPSQSFPDLLHVRNVKNRTREARSTLLDRKTS